jgi:transcription antitermination factor NusG
MLQLQPSSIDHPMWHALHTTPNRERQVAQLLEQRDVRTYLPRFDRPGRTMAGSVRGRRPRWVFPGYVFFRVRPDSDSWQYISRTAGVRRVLTEDAQPAVLADAVIEHLERRLREGLLQPPRRGFQPGEPVVIERGSLAAVDAIFDHELDKPSRVLILVHLLGRPVHVQIDPNHIRSRAS